MKSKVGSWERATKLMNLYLDLPMGKKENEDTTNDQNQK